MYFILNKVREAAQALLKTELTRMGIEGRKKLIEEWSPHLPTYNDPLPHSQSSLNPHHLQQNSIASQENSRTKVRNLTLFLSVI